MSVQTVTQVGVNIEWDDSVVFVFSFQGPSGQIFCGFPHQQVALANQTGTQTQVNAILQSIQQIQLQVTTDPGTWIDTVKQGARGGKINIVFEDSISAKYTTQTLKDFDLQQLFSITG